MDTKKEISKGFTIIEVLVVVTVMLAVFLITIANFSQHKLQFSLSRIAYTFAQDVSRAQNMALAGVPYKDSLGIEQGIDGYGVSGDIIGLGDKKYIMYADKSPGNQQYDATDYVIGTIDFSSSEPGIIIKQIDNVSANKASINFGILTNTTTITQLNIGQSKAVFVFAFASDLTKTKTVSINTSGLVQVK